MEAIMNARVRVRQRFLGRRVAVGVMCVLTGLGPAACGGASDQPDSSADQRVTPTVTLPPPLEATPTSCPMGTAVVAADETTGEVIWSHCAASVSGIEVLAADDKTVLAAEYGTAMSGGVTVLALDAATGSERWSTTIAPFNESYERDTFYADGNQLGSGVVVFSTLEGNESFMVGIDAVSGRERWRVPAESTFVAAHGEDVAIAATPGAMFETPSDAEQPPLHVVAFERATGKVRWREDKTIRDMFAPWGPHIGDNVVVFTQMEPAPEDIPISERRWETVAIDANSGKKLWSREQGPLTVAMVAGDISIGMGQSGPEESDVELEGFDTRTGDRRWTSAISPPPLTVADPTSAVVATGTFTEETPSGVVVVDRSSGAPLWQVEGPVEPAGVSGSLVLLSRPGEIVALDAASGAPRWQIPFAHPFGTELQASSGRLYLSSSQGMFDRTGAADVQAELTMSGGTELATFTLPNGDTVRFVETDAAGAAQYLCAHANQSTSAANCITERDEPMPGGVTNLMPTEGRPVQFPSGVRSLYSVPLPAGHPRPVSVRDASGTIWPAAEATGFDQLLVLDPDVGGGGTMSVRTSLEVVAADGAIVATIAPPPTGPPTGVTSNAPPPFQWLVNLADCYRAQGADYQATPPTAPPTASSPPTSALAVDVVTKAWQACREILLTQSGAPPSAFNPVFLDCMAGRGWLPPLYHQALEPMRSDSIACGVTPP